MKLNLKKVPKLVGKDAKEKFAVLSNLLANTSWPLFLTGASGTGKSVIAMNLAKWYSKEFNVPAYYAQLSPDQTKTSLILGLRLKNGSLVPVKGMVAKAMEEGGIVVIDEATHATQELLLMFNSICDRTTITSIGDEIVYAKDSFRVIFCANTSQYAGNVKLPQSFAQRMIAFNFEYPDFESEVKIAKKIVEDEYKGEINVPDPVFNYVTSIFRDVRNDHFPLSVRNIASAIIVLNAFKQDEGVNIDEFIASFDKQTESVIRGIFSKVYGFEPQNVNEIINDSKVMEIIRFIASIGRDNFKQAIMSAAMVYLDFDGLSYEIEKAKDRLISQLF